MASGKSRINVSIPTASSDGKYHGAFPHGDAPSPANPLAGGATDAISATGALSGSGLVPDFSALSAAFPSSDVTGYTALGIQSKPAGFAWNDTVTGIKTVKITDGSGTKPGANTVYTPHYAQMGLAISQPWGPNLDQYHLLFASQNPDGGWLCDYGHSTSATPGPYNWRAAPAAFLSYTAGTFAFSRKAGNQHIAYVLTSGAKLRLFNVATGAFVDSSAAALGYNAAWPSTGVPWNTGFNQWLMLNATETWVSGNNSASSGNAQYALNLGSPTALTPFGTQLIKSGSVDDTYMGYGNYAYTDQNATQVWDLDNSTTGANALITVSPPFGSNEGFNGDASSHLGILRNYWVATSTINSASLPMAAGIVTQNTGAVNFGTTTTLPFVAKNWGQYHMSGNCWLQGPGPNQYMLQSNFSNTTGSAQSGPYVLDLVNPWTGDTRRLGFHYSIYQAVGPVIEYYMQNHAHWSHDGKLVMFGSNMQGNTRNDLFVMELPLKSGTPPAFP